MPTHLGLVLLAFGFVSSLPAEGPALTVTVRLYNYAGVSSNTMVRAAEITGSLFRRAGLALRFLRCEPGGEDQLICPNAKGNTTLTIRLARTSKAHSRKTLGVSVIPPDGPADLATVFAEHVLTHTTSHSIPAEIGFAAVFAHEIFHLLTGEGGHSSRGLLCHQLGWQDLVAVERGVLELDPDQVRRLQNAYRMRTEPAESGPMPHARRK